MEHHRSVEKIVKGHLAIDGAGVHLVRVVGFHDTKEFDPFLMLDAFDSRNPRDYTLGFPWHPHRGIQTITYVIEGSIEHQDSLGNKGMIGAGDCQWMNAGSGIIHQEMPKASPHFLGAQLWLNLPKAHKMSKPAYGGIEKSQIPIVKEQGYDVHIIAGRYQGVDASFQSQYIDATYLDFEVHEDCLIRYDSQDERIFVYLFHGEVRVEHVDYESKQALLFSNRGPVVMEAKKGTRMILCSSNPLHEPIAWGGPIVMNTQQELAQAFDELEQGTFIK